MITTERIIWLYFLINSFVAGAYHENDWDNVRGTIGNILGLLILLLFALPLQLLLWLKNFVVWFYEKVLNDQLQFSFWWGMLFQKKKWLGLKEEVYKRQEKRAEERSKQKGLKHRTFVFAFNYLKKFVKENKMEEKWKKEEEDYWAGVAKRKKQFNKKKDGEAAKP